MRSELFRRVVTRTLDHPACLAGVAFAYYGLSEARTKERRTIRKATFLLVGVALRRSLGVLGALHS